MATSIEQFKNLDPSQQAIFDQFLSQLSPEAQQQFFDSGFGGLDKAKSTVQSFLDIDEQDVRDRFTRTTAEPAYRDFREQVIPEIQERIAASGSGGGPSEQTSLATAGTRLQEDLNRQFEDVYSGAQDKQLQSAQLFANMSSEELNQLMKYVQTATGTKTFDNVAVQKTDWMDVFQTAAGSAAGAAGQAYGSSVFKPK